MEFYIGPRKFYVIRGFSQKSWREPVEQTLWATDSVSQTDSEAERYASNLFDDSYCDYSVEKWEECDCGEWKKALIYNSLD